MEPTTGADLTIVVWIMDYFGQAWYNIIGQVITGATAATMWFRSKADNPFGNAILQALNFLAGNVLKNKNAE